MESRCISVGAKLEIMTEDFDNLKKDFDKIVKEKTYLEKKSTEKDQNFHDKCNHLWELLSHPVFQRKPGRHMCDQEVHTYNNRIENIRNNVIYSYINTYIRVSQNYN